jgi:hypothetical protein
MRLKPNLHPDPLIELAILLQVTVYEARARRARHPQRFLFDIEHLPSLSLVVRMVPRSQSP